MVFEEISYIGLEHTGIVCVCLHKDRETARPLVVDIYTRDDSATCKFNGIRTIVCPTFYHSWCDLYNHCQIHPIHWALFIQSCWLVHWSAPDDYIGGVFTLKFGTAAGNVQCQSIEIVQDSVVEPRDEVFFVDIKLPLMGPVQKGTPGQTRVIIAGVYKADICICDACNMQQFLSLIPELWRIHSCHPCCILVLHSLGLPSCHRWQVADHMG